MKSTLKKTQLENYSDVTPDLNNKSLTSFFGNFTAEIINQYNLVEIALAVANQVFLNRTEIEKLSSVPLSLMLRIAETANNLHFRDHQNIINPIIYFDLPNSQDAHTYEEASNKIATSLQNIKATELFFKFSSFKTREDFLLIGNALKLINGARILIDKNDIADINKNSPFLTKPYLLEVNCLEDYKTFVNNNFEINYTISIHAENNSLSQRANDFLTSLYQLRELSTQNLRRITVELPYVLDKNLDDMKSTLGLETLQYLIFCRLAFPEVKEISVSIGKIGLKLGKTALLFGATNLGFAAIDETTANFLSLPCYQSVIEELNQDVEHFLE
ncbi:MAG: hypothetical protein KBC84_10455 [Proteobacteria bacterium]|nr:hypothetical protein [Pseudomonadota bacterium]